MFVEADLGPAPSLFQIGSPAFHAPRIALLGNFLPRLCGLATYTSHVYEAMRRCLPDAAVDVYAMVDPGRSYVFPAAVTGTIPQEDRETYRMAARRIESSGAAMLWVQHEFGIYGGPAGRYLLDLLERVEIPVRITLHTVLEDPNDDQRAVMERLIARADTLVVMARKGHEILSRVYGVSASRILVIPHGVPDRPYTSPDAAKRRFDMDGRKTILTFGLLSPGKGIETMISALPAIAARCPEALYVVLGATHPHLVAQRGERYRDELQALARHLGVERQLRFVNGFVGEDELIDRIAAADIYVTPYLNPAQITSGALAYAVGLGKPVISTPYVHAAELLAQGHGRLVDFGDVGGLARTVTDLLLDDASREDLSRRTYELGRSMTWDRVIACALDHFGIGRRDGAVALAATSVAIPL